MHRLLEDFPSVRRGLVLHSGLPGEVPEQRLVFRPLYQAYGATGGAALGVPPGR